MSRQSKKTITCPECGEVNEFIIWQSLNGDMDPEAKQQLLDGTLFGFECKKCGHKSSVSYPILYHDMKNEAMVYYVDEDSVEKTQAIMSDTENKTGPEMSGYRKRIVTDQNALREKAIIFEHGLDDRIIEIIKLLYYFNATEKFPDANITAIYFLVADGKFILEFFGDNTLSAEIPISMYDNVKKKYADRLEAAGNTESIINLDWARAFLNG